MFLAEVMFYIQSIWEGQKPQKCSYAIQFSPPIFLLLLGYDKHEATFSSFILHRSLLTPTGGMQWVCWIDWDLPRTALAAGPAVIL